MIREREPARRANGYFIGFGLTAVMLGGATLLLVLVVFPHRFVLDSGLRESGRSYPAQTVPFVPPADVLRAPSPRPAPPREVVRGPAEVFWGEVEPLLRQGRYARALPLFERWLADHPDDRDVRRELALTLQHAGRGAEAASVMTELLSRRDDPGTRLLLARELRDLGRIDDASVQYARLRQSTADDGSLALEWARALAWASRYEEATEVLERAMEAHPGSVDLRVELARVSYWSGHLDRATELLAGLDEETLRRSGAVPLKAEVVAATTPEEEKVVPAAADSLGATAVERAQVAASQQDFQGAAALFGEALRESPGDTAAWRAYADVLQFGLDDPEGAREALLRIERLGGADSRMELRLAQLSIWTGRNDDARWRLRGLLTQAGGTGPAGPPEESQALPADQVAEIWALLGDLRRWDGDRVASGDAYASSLGLDSTNVRAHGGLEELAAAGKREVAEQERPRLGADTYVLVDSDHFTRVDVGATGVRVSGSQVWAIRTGSRWLGGSDPVGSLQDQQRLFFDLESARWWRWGTLRTGVHLGLEQAGSGSSDVSFGGSLRLADLGGFRTDVRYEHGPAYALTSTLQSVLAGVTQDRFTASVSRRLGARWSLSATGDAAWLSARLPDDPPGSWRFEGALSVGKSVTDALVVGVNARGATYTAPAPVENGLRLFWDPSAVAAGGIYAQWDKELEDGWSLGLRLNPSLALIDERSGSGFQTVPHGSAEVGVRRVGSRFETALDGFYYQGRFDGYRAYGLRLSFSAGDWLLGGREAR